MSGIARRLASPSEAFTPLDATTRRLEFEIDHYASKGRLSLGVPSMSGCRQLDSRLVVPPLPPRHVRRPRLITALDGADVPLVLLAAGPGAGKTVLLSEWVLGRDGPVGWMTVTTGDVAPPRFWHLLWSALRACGAQDDGLSPVTAGTDSTERVQALLALGEGSIGEYLVAEVLEGQPGPVRRLLTVQPRGLSGASSGTYRNRPGAVFYDGRDQLCATINRLPERDRDG